MALPQITLAVVGAAFANPGKMPTRRFEIALCAPGDPIELRPEPKNPKDERAIAVYSERGVQLGYISAERAPLIGQRIRSGHEPFAIFQASTSFGALIRVAFDGDEPILPPEPSTKPEMHTDPEPDWHPDPEWPD